MGNRIDKIKEIIANNANSSVNPLDIVNPKTEWSDEETANKRLLICQSCPELIKLTKQCMKCGCFMSIKTKMEKATCPIGKW